MPSIKLKDENIINFVVRKNHTVVAEDQEEEEEQEITAVKLATI